MRTLAIDIETYSSVDLLKSGVYKYTQSPDFEILLFAYSFDDEPVQIVDLTKCNIPNEVQFALLDKNTLKTAFNANFERTCIAKYFNIELPADQWECTSVKGSMLGLPLNLDGAAKALDLTSKKDVSGKSLIRYFSLPCKPTKANGMRTRNLPEHDPVKWEQFKSYCVQDVVVEKAIRDKISYFTIPPAERKLWILDQKINDRGILVDRHFIGQAIKMDEVNKAKLLKEAEELTALANPNSAAQLKEWLAKEMDESVDSLTKESVTTLLGSTDCDIVKRVLTLRQEMSKTSVKKYEAMLKGIGDDDRVRGLLQFYGANRTGRWAGRLVQVQNLPQNHLGDLDLGCCVFALFIFTIIIV